MDDLDLEFEFLAESDERDHDLGFDLDLFLRDIGRGFEDGAGLHLGDLGIRDAEAATAVAEHGVLLMQAGDALDDGFNLHADAAGEVHLLLLGVGEEFVERRIEEADRGGVAFERLEDAGEVLALIGQELREGRAAALGVRGEDHLAHGVDAISLEEHVLGAGEADAGGAESQRGLGLLGIVGIRANAELGDFRAPIHELLEVFDLLGFQGRLVAVDETGDDLGGLGGELAGVNIAAGAVDREVIAFFEDLAFDRDGALVVVDLDIGRAADANLAHLAGDEGGV